MIKSKNFFSLIVCGLAVLVAANASAEGWYTSLSGGYYFREGDSRYQGGQAYSIKQGYDINQRWGMEGTVGMLPLMDANDNAKRGDGQHERDNVGVELRIEGLYHFVKDENRVFDPYWALGGGWYVLKNWSRESGDGLAFVSTGPGFFVNITDDVFFRADYRYQSSGSNTQQDHLLQGGFGVRWGADREADALGNEGGLERVYFAFDSSRLDPRAQGVLAENAQTIIDKDYSNVTIEGHCDERGTNEYNLALGQRRAEAGYQYLRSMGVVPEKLSTVSYGEERPADPGHNEQAWAKNRRIQFSVN